MLKPRTLTSKIAERITRLKKFHVEALNLTFKIQITLNYKLATLYLKNSLLQKELIFLKRWVLTQ